MLRKLVFVIFLSVLTSCSYIYGDRGIIKNRDTDYLSAKIDPPLMIPEGLSSSTIESHYPIAERNYPASKARVNLTPPELNESNHTVTRPITKPVETAENTHQDKHHFMDYLAHPKKTLVELLNPNRPEKPTSEPIKQAQTTTHKKRYLTDYFSQAKPSHESVKTTSSENVTHANSQTAASQKKRYLMDYFS